MAVCVYAYVCLYGCCMQMFEHINYLITIKQSFLGITNLIKGAFVYVFVGLLLFVYVCMCGILDFSMSYKILIFQQSAISVFNNVSEHFRVSHNQRSLTDVL